MGRDGCFVLDKKQNEDPTPTKTEFFKKSKYKKEVEI